MLETVWGAKNKHLLQIGTDTLYKEITWHSPDPTASEVELLPIRRQYVRTAGSALHSC